eukprot:2460265-Pyramimonas_sp.AAC.2
MLQRACAENEGRRKGGRNERSRRRREFVNYSLWQIPLGFKRGCKQFGLVLLRAAQDPLLLFRAAEASLEERRMS